MAILLISTTNVQKGKDMSQAEGKNVAIQGKLEV
jgi:hypothetical protein